MNNEDFSTNYLKFDYVCGAVFIICYIIYFFTILYKLNNKYLEFNQEEYIESHRTLLGSINID